VLAHVIVSKFCDHLPLHRQSGTGDRPKSPFVPPELDSSQLPFIGLLLGKS
jgi:hypothetical protein